MRRQTLRLFASVVLAAAILSVAAPAAWAPRSWGLPSLIVSCGDGKQFNGALNLASFTSKGSELFANGTISGNCSGEVIESRFTAPAFLGAATCTGVDVLLGDITVQGKEGPITLDLERTVGGALIRQSVLLDNPTNDRRLRGPLCAVAGMSRGAPTKVITAALNRLLGVLNGLP